MARLAGARCFAGRDPGAGLRRSLLGLPDVDLRTDSFVQLGKMYGTTPGFYLLVGPNWQGEVPKGITRVFRAPTNTALVAPRYFQDDTPEDKRAIQGVLTGS